MASSRRVGPVAQSRYGGFLPVAAGRQRFLKQRWAPMPDPEGWRKCHSSRGHGRHQQPTRPRRRVPADLHGKCFNCFSVSHTAAQCSQRPRCFRCQALGHRSYACPGAKLNPQRRLVWRPAASSTTSGRAAPSQRSVPASAGRIVVGTAQPPNHAHLSQRSVPASAGRIASSTAPSRQSSSVILELGTVCSPVGHAETMTSVQEANQGGDGGRGDDRVSDTVPMQDSPGLLRHLMLLLRVM
jgi:hypothetical protein